MMKVSCERTIFKRTLQFEKIVLACIRAICYQVNAFSVISVHFGFEVGMSKMLEYSYLETSMCMFHL